MKRFKKGIALALSLVTLSSVFVGCSSKAGNEGGDSSSTSSSTVVVDFWTAPQVVQYNFWEEKALAFNETKTQVNGKTIEVKVQQMPETPSSEAGIQNAIATGTVPAISENINRGFAATLAESDVIYEMQDEEWFNEIVASRVMEETMKGWAIDGKQYVLPMYVNPMIWQWNAKALKELGFNEAPETIAEFDAVLQAFVDNRDKMNAIGVTHTFYRPSLTRPDQWWDRWYDFQMPYEAISGGKPWVEGNTLALDRESAIEAFELIGKFGNTIQTGELSSIWVEDNPSVLVTINAPWEIELMRENGKVYGEDYVYGKALVKNEGDKPYNYADSKGLVLYKHDSISEEEHLGAVEFIKWLYNAENSAQTDLDWLNATTMLPVRGDLDTNEAFTAKMAEYPELAALAESAPYGIPCMANSKMTDIQSALTESGMAPYMNEVFNSEPLNPPSAEQYVDQAFEAMKQIGGLE